MTRAYYSENDPGAAQWLRNLAHVKSPILNRRADNASGPIGHGKSGKAPIHAKAILNSMHTWIARSFRSLAYAQNLTPDLRRTIHKPLEDSDSIGAPLSGCYLEFALPSFLICIAILFAGYAYAILWLSWLLSPSGIHRSMFSFVFDLSGPKTRVRTLCTFLLCLFASVTVSTSEQTRIFVSKIFPAACNWHTASRSCRSFLFYPSSHYGISYGGNQ